ncbi:hypothetical Protein YC6258_05053 [Gynuella sunshinyii YC6258]|uniref:Uncharacterized protein n=1 Tax=Gynuella sunshinyii YC6258 TaxID=1445510 RepID=A0A0C5VUV5_9GAMM|nr:hypothetical Protein YC6258_05053 [Gynuella sunshinyii YC6258]
MFWECCLEICSQYVFSKMSEQGRIDIFYDENTGRIDTPLYASQLFLNSLVF